MPKSEFRYWIVVSRKSGEFCSEAFNTGQEAWYAACDLGRIEDGALDSSYLHTIIVDEVAETATVHDWSSEIEAELIAEARYQRELISDYYASR